MMTKPTAADRIRRGSPVIQAGAGRAVRDEVRVKPVRVTVDLEPSAYEDLREWAHQARMSHADVLRSLVDLLVSDSAVATQISNPVLPPGRRPGVVRRREP